MCYNAINFLIYFIVDEMKLYKNIRSFMKKRIYALFNVYLMYLKMTKICKIKKNLILYTLCVQRYIVTT